MSIKACQSPEEFLLLAIIDAAHSHANPVIGENNDEGWALLARDLLPLILTEQDTLIRSYCVLVTLSLNLSVNVLLRVFPAQPKSFSG